MTQTVAEPRALRINPAALVQKVSQQLRKHRAGPHPVLLVRAAPEWPHPSVLTTPDDQRVTVVPCVSALAVWEQLATAPDGIRVLLTDLSERDLGTGILTRVFRQQLLTVEPWELVAECFGAQRLEARLQAERWAGEALLDAMPAGGWTRLAGPVLSRDVALRQLAAVRLGLSRLGLTADDLDAAALLRWSALPGAPEALAELREAERDGLLGWLASEFGRPAQALCRLLAAGHASDALPLGLVCDAVWSATDPDSLRAQGRIEQYFGNGALEAATVRGYAETATSVVTELLASDREAASLGRRVLDRAEELLAMFAATSAARHSPILRSGFEHRVGRVATALTAALTDPGPDPLAAARTAVAELADHRLAASQPHRVQRASMALRLLAWLRAPAPPPTSVGDAVARQIGEWGWVDLALAHVWTGEDVHPGLQRVFGTIYDRASQRRRELDQAFAARLAAWTAAGTDPGEVLTVENLLERVVAPVVRAGRRGLLLIVLDGMSADAAVDLAEDLARQSWVEYDPLARPDAAEIRRRAAVSALPSVTEVSRASLFAGALRRGDQRTEQKAFGQHPLWRKRPAKLFHKSLVPGSAGEVLDEELTEALSEAGTLVGVVVNTIDDALEHGRESADPGWRLSQLGPLRTLLDHARYHGRAVVITSDHGHVPERDGALRPAAAAGSARHRTDPAPAGDGEVELTGPRVVNDDQRVVALWDPRARYLPRRAGYHGGASLAEVTVPVLAFLHLGAAAPAGWAELATRAPGWWGAPAGESPAPATAPASASAMPAPEQPQPATPARAQPPARAATPKSAPTEEPLFDLGAPAPLVDSVLESEMFAAQHALTPRRVPVEKVRGALAALVEAGGTLPAVVVCRSAGEKPERARGFLTTLQRIFNVDNYPVLSVSDDGRTVRLELPLLREQFGVPGGRS